MEWNRKNVLLALPVFAVGVANLANLSGYYNYHELPVVAFLLAISFKKGRELTCHSMSLNSL